MTVNDVGLTVVSSLVSFSHSRESWVNSHDVQWNEANGICGGK